MTTHRSVDGAAQIALLLLLLLAAVLRFSSLPTLPGFNSDEAGEVYYARQFVETGVPRLHPYRPYLGPYLLWSSAVLIKAFGLGVGVVRSLPAAAGVLGVGFAWLIGRRAGGTGVGLAAAALFAVGPWSVGYSRQVLSVSFVPVFAVAAWWLMQRLVEEPGPGRAAAVGAVVGAGAVYHPTGLVAGAAILAGAFVLAGPRWRDLLRPSLVGAAILGYVVTGWPTGPLIGGLLGLVPDLDLSATHVDETVWSGPLGRLLAIGPLLLDTAAGGRTLAWIAGGRSSQFVVLWGVQFILLVGVGGALWRALRRRDRHAAALLAGAGAAVVVVSIQSARFDLHVVSRERYLLVPAALVVIAAAIGLVGHETRRRAGAAAVGVAAVLCLAGLGQAVGTLRAGASTVSDTFLIAHPDAKQQAGEWILGRMQPGEEGLLLAGDGWSYWPVVYFVGEVMPSDFVHEPTSKCASEILRTRHRRRFLFEYRGGDWVEPILACLDEAGYGRPAPTFVSRSIQGVPILGVWELPPEP
jgi:4-amino-4-deoxy-L-arabinose transferase-like glycosyltransferase